jgi:hypothetical protein
MKKLVIIVSFLVFPLLFASSVKADTQTASLANSYCNFLTSTGQNTGNITLTNSCVVYENVDGVSAGNLTIPANVTVTLHKQLVFAPGYQINIQSSGTDQNLQTGIIYINTGGSIVQGRLCVKDANNNHYADTIAVTTDPYGVALTTPITQIDQQVANPVTNLCSTGYNYRESMNSLTMVDTSTSTNDATKVATSDRELLRLGFTVAGVKDALAVGNPVKIVGDNLLVCAGTVCPTVTFASDSGNIYATNRVGIGTTSPLYNLDIGDGSSRTVFRVNGSNSGTSGGSLFIMALGNTSSLYMGNYSSIYGGAYNNTFVIHNGLGTPIALMNGNVGVGTTTPTYALQVAGTVYASGSSRDYKEKIKPLEVDSSKIYNLKPVSYDYKKDYQNLGYNLAGGRQFGLIAEDVYPIIPELVISLGNKKTANIDYSKLSVLLLDQMQKQKKEIDSLQQQVNNLQSEVDLIKKSLKISR